MAMTSASGRHLRLVTACALAALTTGCATDQVYRNPSDPWEPFNRVVYQFNDDFDTVFLKPVAKGYQFITPAPVDRGITNFFDNLADVRNGVNNALQFKMTRAFTSVGRVVVNSTVGVLGFVDVASNLNMPKYNEDFGQTLGTWGVAPGPYVVLPFLGPSTGRDTVTRGPRKRTSACFSQHGDSIGCVSSPDSSCHCVLSVPACSTPRHLSARGCG